VNEREREREGGRYVLLKVMRMKRGVLTAKERRVSRVKFSVDNKNEEGHGDHITVFTSDSGRLLLIKVSTAVLSLYATSHTASVRR
jgi:hypothetical protein